MNRSREPRDNLVQFRDDRGKAPARLADTELEEQVIGAVLADNALFKDVSFLEGAQFSDQTNGELWDAISAQLMQGKPATPSVLVAVLGDAIESFGGRDRLSGLASLGAMIGPAVADVAERLRQLAQWRRLAALGSEIQDWVRRQASTPDEALSQLLREAEGAIQQGRVTARTKREVAAAAISHALEERQPVSVGITPLDFLFHGGLIPKRLYGIAGLYGRGKTILAGTISDNLNARGVKHLSINLETPPEDIELRNCARHLDLNAAQIHDKDDPLHPRFVTNAQRYVEQMPDYTYYEYMPGATMDDVHRKIIRAVHRFGVRGFILDYWQLIRGREKGVSEEAHFRECANRLAAVCRREDIWGVVLAQCDKDGKLLYSEGLHHAASLLVRLVREENEQTAFFTTQKSNYTRYADTGSEAAPGMIFDQAGPHFRNTNDQDFSLLAHAETKPADFKI